MVRAGNNAKKKKNREREKPVRIKTIKRKAPLHERLLSLSLFISPAESPHRGGTLSERKHHEGIARVAGGERERRNGRVVVVVAMVRQVRKQRSW